MNCYFCNHDIPEQQKSLGLWYCPICPNNPGIISSYTAKWKAFISFRIGNDWMSWELYLNSPNARLVQLEDGRLKTILTMEKRVPDIDITTVIEKTKMLLLFT
jgi:hypothetical protein